MRDGGARMVFDRGPLIGEPSAPGVSPLLLDPERFHGDPPRSRSRLDSTGRHRADLGRRLAHLCRDRFAAAKVEPAPAVVASPMAVSPTRSAEFEVQLRSAGALQRNLRSPLPSIRGVELTVLQRAAGFVGGDVCEVFRLDAGHVAIAVADACGHDLAAGMLAMFLSRWLRSLAVDVSGGARDPAEVLGIVNRELCQSHLEECQFVTAFYGVFDEDTRILRWSRAGAPLPLVTARDGAARRLGGGGPLLGVIENAAFEAVETLLVPGDALLVFTDGITDFPGESFVAGLEAGTRGAAEAHPASRVPLRERLADWERSLAASDRAGVERDDVTVMALFVPVPPGARFVRAIDPLTRRTGLGGTRSPRTAVDRS